METPVGSGAPVAGDSSSARVAVETTKLLVGGGGGGISPTGNPVTSSTGALKDYGGAAHQLSTREQQLDNDTNTGFYVATLYKFRIIIIRLCSRLTALWRYINFFFVVLRRENDVADGECNPSFQTK